VVIVIVSLPNWAKQPSGKLRQIKNNISFDSLYMLLSLLISACRKLKNNSDPVFANNSLSEFVYYDALHNCQIHSHKGNDLSLSHYRYL